MLSPRMMTRSYGNLVCAIAICRPTSYWAVSPVPLSPMATNFSDPALLGRADCCAATAATMTSGAVARRRRARGLDVNGNAHRDATRHELACEPDRRSAVRVERA